MAEPAARLWQLGVRRGLVARKEGSDWSLAGLAGRLVELSGVADSACLTAAFGLVLKAQLLDEPVAWLTLDSQAFFPPDAAASGVDLNALAVVRVPSIHGIGRAADHLARSGAFGLLVADLADGSLRTAMLSRLRGLAHKHDIAMVFLTQTPTRPASMGSIRRGTSGSGSGSAVAPGGAMADRSGSGSGLRRDGFGVPGALGSLVSLRGIVRRTRTGEDRFECEIRFAKDKRRAPGWRVAETCRGPSGLH